MARRHDYPVGIPLRPPPGWRGRPVVPARRTAGGGLALRAGLLAAMVVVCAAVGWLSVNLGRQPARRPAAKKGAKKEEPRAEVRPAPPAPAAVEPVAPPPKKAAEPAPEKPAPARPAAPETKPAARLSYEGNVLPIVRRSCLSCHNARKRKGDLDLSSFAALRRGGEGGPAVVPGRPGDSPLYESVAEGRMPPGRRLPAADVKAIRDWIEAGARGR